MTSKYANYLFEKIAQDKQSRDWLKEQIFEEGPPHKITQHSLVLERLTVLLNAMEANAGEQFKPIADEQIILHKHDHSLLLPLSFPESSLNVMADDPEMEKLTKGPDHEIAYTAVLLQVIEWMINHNKS
jgi:hypothetical protein